MRAPLLFGNCDGVDWESGQPQTVEQAAPAARVPFPQRRLIVRLLGLAFRYRWGCVRVVALQMLLVGLGLGGLGLTGFGIDYLRHQIDPRGPAPAWPGRLSAFDTARPLTVIGTLAGAVFGVALVNAALRYAAAASAANLSQQVLLQLRSEIHDKLQRLSFGFFDAHPSSSLINRAAGDAQAVRTFVDGVIVRVFTVSLTLLAYLGYMWNVHPGLTLTCLATTPLLWLGAIRFSRRVQPAYRRASELADQVVTTLVENISGAQVVKGFGRQAEEIAKFERATLRVRVQRESIFRRISTYQPLMGGLTQVNLLVLLAYGGYLVIRGEISLGGGLFVMASLLQEFSAQIANITNIANTIQGSLVAAERVFEVLDAPVTIVSPRAPVRLFRACGSVSFQGVDFGYDEGRQVLSRVELEVAPGECLGIAGETGAGKSTLLALVARFYDVRRGAVRIDGIDVRQLHLDDLRRNLGIVFQDSFLFSNTVAANIAFGDPLASQADIERAARLAAAHRFIRDLPDGYQTVVGEHGSNLSGGQRQRLALARALLLDPPILLLDDPLAAVDPETEHEIQAAIDRMLRDRTTLLVSNRVSSLRRAARVVVLRRGRIVQEGPPAELLRLPGPFRRLAELQSCAAREVCRA